MKDKVLITGISGMIGNFLAQMLKDDGYQVIGLTHSKSKKDKSKNIYYWDLDKGYIDDEVFENLSYIVHLSGYNVANKWTSKNKERIIKSRIDSSKLLFKNVEKRKVNLKAFISSSAIGYYGYNDDSSKSFTEDDNSFVNDFLSKVCFEWEREADNFKKLGIRVVKIRTGIVLSKNSKAFGQIKSSVNKNLGIYFGTAFFPWIHIKDICLIFAEAIKDKSMEGAYNGVSPNAGTMKQFISILGEVMNKKRIIMIRLPNFFVRFIFGEKADMFLVKNNIEPKRLKDKKFEYKYGTLEKSFKDII